MLSTIASTLTSSSSSTGKPTSQDEAMQTSDPSLGASHSRDALNVETAALAGIESRRAEPHHLSSYPISSLTHPESASAAAASLAHAAPKPAPAWTPNPISAASAAACLAHAGREAGGLRGSPSPSRIWPGGPAHDLKESWSLHGARGAMSPQGNRRRADSSPADLRIAEGNAAIPSHTRRDSGFATGPEDGMPAQMRQRSDVLNAAAVSMVNDRLKREEISSPPKRLYEVISQSPSRIGVPRKQNHSYHEGATRVQAEGRLANIRYNSDGGLTAKGRARAASLDSCHPRLESSNTQGLDENSEQAERRKRGQNALLLMSTARKNVQTRMYEQDRQITESRFMRKDWLSKATGIAQRQADQRMQRRKHDGEVSIGGGAYMTQEELNRTAERNMRPVINDINERAGEYHQLQRERREAKTRNMKRRLDGNKQICGFRRRQNGVREEGHRPVGDMEEKTGTRGASFGVLNQTRDHEGVEGTKVHAMTAPVPEGQSTPLDKITGRSRTLESLSPLNDIGMVRGHIVKTRTERYAALAREGVGPTNAPVSVGRDTVGRPASPVDMDERRPSSSGTRLLGLLKRQFEQKTQTPDQDAPSAPVSHTTPTITGRQTSASRQSVGSVLFDRIRGTRVGVTGAPGRPLRSAPGSISDGQPEAVAVLGRDCAAAGPSAIANPQPTTTTPNARIQKEAITAPVQERTTGGRGAENATRIRGEDEPPENFNDAREEGPTATPVVLGVPEEVEVVLQSTVPETLITEQTGSPDEAVNVTYKVSMGSPIIEVAPKSWLPAATSGNTHILEGVRPSTIPEETIAGTTITGRELDIPQPAIGDAMAQTLPDISDEAGAENIHRGVKLCPVVLNRIAIGADEREVTSVQDLEAEDVLSLEI